MSTLSEKLKAAFDAKANVADLSSKADKTSVPQPLNNLELEDILV